MAVGLSPQRPTILPMTILGRQPTLRPRRQGPARGAATRREQSNDPRPHAHRSNPISMCSGQARVGTGSEASTHQVRKTSRLTSDAGRPSVSSPGPLCVRPTGSTQGGPEPGPRRRLGLPAQLPLIWQCLEGGHSRVPRSTPRQGHGGSGRARHRDAARPPTTSRGKFRGWGVGHLRRSRDGREDGHGARCGSDRRRSAGHARQVGGDQQRRLGEVAPAPGQTCCSRWRPGAMQGRLRQLPGAWAIRLRASPRPPLDHAHPRPPP